MIAEKDAWRNGRDERVSSIGWNKLAANAGGKPPADGLERAFPDCTEAKRPRCSKMAPIPAGRLECDVSWRAACDGMIRQRPRHGMPHKPTNSERHCGCWHRLPRFGLRQHAAPRCAQQHAPRRGIVGQNPRILIMWQKPPATWWQHAARRDETRGHESRPQLAVASATRTQRSPSAWVAKIGTTQTIRQA